MSISLCSCAVFIVFFFFRGAFLYADFVQFSFISLFFLRRYYYYLFFFQLIFQVRMLKLEVKEHNKEGGATVGGWYSYAFAWFLSPFSV